MPAYAETNADLVRLAGSADKRVITRALNAASAEIDAAFAVAGYIVPLDVSAIVDTTSRERLEAKLDLTCQALAAGILASVPSENRGATSKQKKDRDIARDWLKFVRKRKVQFALPRAKSPGLSVVGDSNWRATEELVDYADAVLSDGC